jgi:hypothetical protein
MPHLEVGTRVEIPSAIHWDGFRNRDKVLGKIVRRNGGYYYVKIDNAPKDFPEAEVYLCEMIPTLS